MNIDKLTSVLLLFALTIASGTLLAVMLKLMPGFVLWISSVSWNLAAL